MNGAYTAAKLQRSLAAAYRFHDAFFQPFDERTPSVATPLEVSIPSLDWRALRAASDFTYRFSWMTLTEAMPSNAPAPPQPASFAVEVVAVDGNYVNLEPISLTLPLPIPTPPRHSDFLISKPLWPTTAFRPPPGETAVRGVLHSLTAQPVANLTVEVWLGAAPTPPPGTPFTRSNSRGEFLFRFPLVKGTPGDTAIARIRLDGGAVGVAPGSLPIAIGRAQIIPFQRT